MSRYKDYRATNTTAGMCDTQHHLPSFDGQRRWMKRLDRTVITWWKPTWGTSLPHLQKPNKRNSPRQSCLALQYICRYLRRLKCPPPIYSYFTSTLLMPTTAVLATLQNYLSNPPFISTDSPIISTFILTAVLIKLYTEDPLQHVPGSLIACLSPLWFWNLTWRGIECRTITALKRVIIVKRM